MRIIRSAIWAIVSSWVIITRVCPYSLTQLFKRLITSSSFLESRLPVGSSARIIAGLLARALAIAARCCCPPDRVEGRAWSLS